MAAPAFAAPVALRSRRLAGHSLSSRTPVASLSPLSPLSPLRRARLPPPRTLPSPAALSALAASLPPSSLIILSLSAAHCRACAGARPRFRKSAAAAASERTVFAEMEVGPGVPENRELGEKLGVRALPFFAILRTQTRGGVEVVDAGAMPWNRLGELDEKVARLQGP